MLLVKNKKATWDSEILDKFVAGIKLHGYEVKAIKEGKANFEGAFVQIMQGAPMLINMHIGRYSKQGQTLSDTEYRRSRALLLNKKEIEKLHKELSQKGKTAIPLALLLLHNLVKLELGIVKGRKKLDKKNLEKQRQIKRDTDREMKDFHRASYAG